MAGVRSAHHVFGIEHLLRELGNRQGTVLLRSTRRQRSETGHEEMETGERDHVHGQLAQVAIQLAGEAQTARGTRQGSADEVVEVAISRSGQFQRAEADVVKS